MPATGWTTSSSRSSPVAAAAFAAAFATAPAVAEPTATPALTALAVVAATALLPGRRILLVALLIGLVAVVLPSWQFLGRLRPELLSGHPALCRPCRRRSAGAPASGCSDLPAFSGGCCSPAPASAAGRRSVILSAPVGRGIGLDLAGSPLIVTVAGGAVAAVLAVPDGRDQPPGRIPEVPLTPTDLPVRAVRAAPWRKTGLTGRAGVRARVASRDAAGWQVRRPGMFRVTADGDCCGCCPAVIGSVSVTDFFLPSPSLSRCEGFWQSHSARFTECKLSPSSAPRFGGFCGYLANRQVHD